MDEIAGCEIEQNWPRYSDEEHAIWRFLFERQQRLLAGAPAANTSTGCAASGSRAATAFPISAG